MTRHLHHALDAVAKSPAESAIDALRHDFTLEIIKLSDRGEITLTRVSQLLREYDAACSAVVEAAAN